MAYLIFMANGEEYARRELRAPTPIVIGRAPDCDVAVRDIILSRHHCRIERTEDGKAWRIVDLHSKNGTHLRGQPVETHVLRDGDELRIGRSRLTYKSGPLVPAAAAPASPKKKHAPAVNRPVDPHEALAGTVSGMVVCEPGETERHQGMPMPQPRPVDPTSFAADGVYDMINEIVNSSRDSIQAQASQPTRMQRAMPVPGVTSANRATTPVAAPRAKPRVSFALQADHGGQPRGKSDKLDAPPPPLQSKPLSPPARRFRGHGRRFWIATTSVAATVLFLAGWITLAVRASHREPPPTPPPPTSATQAQPAKHTAPPAVEPDRRSGAPDVYLTGY
jgi:hypothetical protein